MFRVNFGLAVVDEPYKITSVDGKVVYDLSFGCYRKFARKLDDYSLSSKVILGNNITKCGGFSFPERIEFIMESNNVVFWNEKYDYKQYVNIYKPDIGYLYPDGNKKISFNQEIRLSNCLVSSIGVNSVCFRNLDTGLFDRIVTVNGDRVLFSPIVGSSSFYMLWNNILYDLSMINSYYGGFNLERYDSWMLKGDCASDVPISEVYRQVAYGINSLDIMPNGDSNAVALLYKNVDKYVIEKDGTPSIYTSVYLHLKEYGSADSFIIDVSSDNLIFDNYIVTGIDNFSIESGVFVKLIRDSDGNIYALVFDSKSGNFYLFSEDGAKTTLSKVGFTSLMLTPPIVGYYTYETIDSFVNNGYNTNYRYYLNIGLNNAFVDVVNNQQVMVIHSINSALVDQSDDGTSYNKGNSFIMLAYVDINYASIKRVAYYKFPSDILLNSLVKIESGKYLALLRNYRDNKSILALVWVNDDFSIGIRYLESYDYNILGIFGDTNNVFYLPTDNFGYGVISENYAISVKAEFDSVSIVSYPTDVNYTVSAINYLGNKVYARIMAKILSPNAEFADGSTIKIFKVYPNSDFQDTLRLKYGYKALIEFKILDTVI